MLTFGSVHGKMLVHQRVIYEWRAVAVWLCLIIKGLPFLGLDLGSQRWVTLGYQKSPGCGAQNPKAWLVLANQMMTQLQFSLESCSSCDQLSIIGSICLFQVEIAWHQNHRNPLSFTHSSLVDSKKSVEEWRRAKTTPGTEVVRTSGYQVGNGSW